MNSKSMLWAVALALGALATLSPTTGVVANGNQSQSASLTQSIPDETLWQLYGEAALEWGGTAQDMQRNHEAGRLIIEDLGNDTYSLQYGGDMVIVEVQEF